MTSNCIAIERGDITKLAADAIVNAADGAYGAVRAQTVGHVSQDARGTRMITIRSAHEGDAEAIAGFQESMALETEGRRLDAARIRTGVRRALGDEDRGFYLVAESEGQTVGSLFVTREWSDWRNGWFWWIQSVFVDAAHRRAGSTGVCMRRSCGGREAQARSSGSDSTWSGRTWGRSQPTSRSGWSGPTICCTSLRLAVRSQARSCSLRTGTLPIGLVTPSRWRATPLVVERELTWPVLESVGVCPIT